MKIQSIFTAAGILAIAMTSCTSDETVMKPGTQIGQINYSVVTPNMTRATNNYTSTNKPNEFTVWAFNGENCYYKDANGKNTGDVIVNTSGSWTPKAGTPDRFWPKYEGSNWGGLDFYAYVDHDDKIDDSGKKIAGYEIESDASDQLDLMYAVSEGVKQEDHGGVVQLSFKHALSQICFTAQNNDPNEKITINTITVGGISGSGDFDPSAEEWSNLASDDSSYSITISEGALTEPTGEETNGVKKKLWIGEDTDGVKSALNLIPQTKEMATAEDSNDGSYLMLNMNVNNEEKNYFIPLSVDWKIGTRYTYNLRFDEGLAITYDVVSVASFDYSTEDRYIVEGHEAVLMRNAYTDEEGDHPALYFATCNIGANSPEQDGKYFWWGDIYGHNVILEGDEYVVEDGFQFSSTNKLIETYPGKYYDIYLKYTKDNILIPEYDAAHNQWGGLWRMPNDKDCKWIISEESTEWQYCDGNKGIITWTFTDKGPLQTQKTNRQGCFVKSKETGNIIFLPYSGDIQGKKLTDRNDCGNFWSSYIDSHGEDDSACAMYYYNDSDNDDLVLMELNENYSRCVGQPIRPVLEM